MFKKVAIAVVAMLIVFVGYVLTRPSHFRYSRSGTYKAKADMVFPYLVSFKKGNEWSPYMKVDPNMKLTYAGEDGQVGSRMEFEGNSDVGAGHLEVLKVVPNELVEIKLTMTKPIYGENIIRYALNEQDGITQFTWSMEGDSGFMGQLISVFIDCEKMVAGDFEKGIANLRPIVEKI